jgi:rhodanese-related sulfurtransferase
MGLMGLVGHLTKALSLSTLENKRCHPHQTIIFYCKAGIRSQQATDLAHSLGYHK